MKKNRFINKSQGKGFVIYLLFAVSIFLVTTGCEEDLLIFDTPDGFVQIGTPAERNVGESTGQTINTVIQLGKPNPNGQTVTVSVVGDDPDRYTVVPQINGTGTIEIPAGETSFVIAVTPVNNFVNDGNSNITISLPDTGNLPVGIGGEGNFRTENVITIIDDDCPFDIEEWYGNYSALQTTSFGELVEGPTVTASAGPAPNTILLTNLFLTGATAVIELDNSDPANPRVIHRSTEFGAVFQTFASTGPLYTFAFASQAEFNTFAVCNKEISLEFYRANLTSAFNPPFSIELTKQ